MEIQGMTLYRRLYRSRFGNYSRGWNLGRIIETRSAIRFLIDDPDGRTCVYEVSWKKWSRANDSNIEKRPGDRPRCIDELFLGTRDDVYIYIYIERTKENDRDRYCSYDLTIVLVLLLFLLKFPFSRLGSSGFVCKSIKQEITTIDITNISFFKIQQIFNSSLAEI